MLSASEMNKLFWQNICDRQYHEGEQNKLLQQFLMLYACFFHSISHFHQAQERKDILAQ